MGGAAGNANLGGLYPLASEHSITLFWQNRGHLGESGYFLAGHAYDVA